MEHGRRKRREGVTNESGSYHARTPPVYTGLAEQLSYTLSYDLQSESMFVFGTYILRYYYSLKYHYIQFSATQSFVAIQVLV